MSVHAAILQLEDLARNAEYAIEKVCSMRIQPTREEYHAFEALDLRFSDIILKLSEKIDGFKDFHAHWALGEGETLKSRTESARTDLMASGQPKA
jgi:hypothetical protein